MPQLDLATYASQIFWLFITFGVLYAYISRSSLPTIREVLQNRQIRIANDLKKASILREEAESAEADFTSVLADARAKSANIIGDTRAKIAEKEAAKYASLEDGFAVHSAESEKRIEATNKQAVHDIAVLAADTAVVILQETAGIEVNKGKAKDLASEISKKFEFDGNA